MKNISFDELKEFSTLDILNFINSYGSYVEQRQVILLPFSIADAFSFDVWLPSDLPLTQNQNIIKIYIFEIIRHCNKAYSLKHVDPKTDKRFFNEKWSKSFTSNNLGYYAENVCLYQFLEMIKFTARLSRIRVFE